jgi:ATP-dependent RNA helicase RhlE
LAEIESFLTKPIKVLDVKKDDYTETLMYTEDTTDNWKLLMREAAKEDEIHKAKKAKKKKKK